MRLAENYMRQTPRESVSSQIEARMRIYIAANGESNEDRITLLDEWVGDILADE